MDQKILCMETKINLFSPIEPNIGVGSFKLLTSSIHLRHLVLNSVDQINIGANHQGDWSYRYNFPDWVVFSYKGIIEIVTNILSGLIVKIKLNKY